MTLQINIKIAALIRAPSLSTLSGFLALRFRSLAMRTRPSSYATGQASSTIVLAASSVAASSVAAMAYSGYHVVLDGASYTYGSLLSWYGNGAAKHIWQ